MFKQDPEICPNLNPGPSLFNTVALGTGYRIKFREKMCNIFFLTTVQVKQKIDYGTLRNNSDPDLNWGKLRDPYRYPSTIYLDPP